VSHRKDSKFKRLLADSAVSRNSGKFHPNSGIDSADRGFIGQSAASWSITSRTSGVEFCDVIGLYLVPLTGPGAWRQRVASLAEFSQDLQQAARAAIELE
jgi:hypothetical protein